MSISFRIMQQLTFLSNCSHLIQSNIIRRESLSLAQMILRALC